MSLKIGLIGTGAICRNQILPVLATSPDWEIAAAFDPQPASLQGLESQFGVKRCHTEIDDFFRSGLDAVYIATPNSSHAEHAIRAMRQGCAVLVEKPCADSVPRAREMLAVARQTGCPVLVGYMSKFNRHNQRARELFAAGEIGRPLAFTSGFGFISSDAQSWRLQKQKAGLGVMGDLMIYQIATALDWFGVQPATCRAWAWPANDAQFTDRSVMARVDFSGGVTLHCDASFDREACYYSVLGEEGSLEVSGSWYQGGGGRLSLWNKNGRRSDPVEEINPYAAELAYFRRVIAGEVPAGDLSLERAVADLEILDALARSSDQGGLAVEAQPYAR